MVFLSYQTKLLTLVCFYSFHQFLSNQNLSAFEEDYGLTAIEAMSFSKPVIVCNDGGGFVEFIKDGENGFIVEPTGEAIAEKIKLLYENKELAKKMGKNAYEFSRKYNWESAIKQINNYIRKKEGEF